MALCVSSLVWAQKNSHADSVQQPLDTFLEGERYKMVEDYTQAIEQYKKTLQLDAHYDPAMFELGRIYLMQRKYSEALMWMEQAYAEDADNKWYAVFLGDLYTASGDSKKAVKVYEHLLEQWPQNTEYMQSLFAIYKQQGAYKKALACLEKLEALQGVSEQTAYDKRDLLLAQDKWPQAVAAIEQLHTRFPQEAKYCNMVAEMYMKQGEKEKALSWYKKVVDIKPDDPYINITLADYYKNAQQPDSAFYYLKAGCANAQLPIAPKVQLLSELMDKSSVISQGDDSRPLQLAKILVETHPKEGMAYAIYGNMLFYDSLYEEACNALQYAIAQDSSNYRLWEQMILGLGQLEDYPKLVDYSQRAIDNFPNMVFPYYMNALSHFLLEQREAAIRSSRMGLQVSTNKELNEQFYLIIGDAQHALDRNDKAFEAYDACLKINPKNAMVLNNYAYYLALDSLQLDRAEQMSAQAIAIDPNANNMDTYAWVLYRLQRYPEAEKYIAKVLRQDKNPSAEVFLHAGDIYFKQNNMKKALKYWKKALEKEPDNSSLQNKIQTYGGL